MKVKELIEKIVDNVDGQFVGNLMSEVIDNSMLCLEQRISSTVGEMILQENDEISSNDELMNAEVSEDNCNKINDYFKENIETLFKMSTFFTLMPTKTFVNSIELFKNIIDEQFMLKRIALVEDEETLVMIYNMRDAINFEASFHKEISNLGLSELEQLVILTDSLAITKNHRAIIDNDDYSELCENISKTIKAYENIRTIKSIMEGMSNEQ